VPLRWKRTKNRQAGPQAGAVVTAPLGKRARVSLAQRLGNALVLRAFYRAASSPAFAAGAALAAGVIIGAALILGVLAQLAAQQGASA
jgi:predicted phage tail protein